MDKAIGRDIKPEKDQLNKIKTTFEEKYQITVSDKDALDCYIALFYLGRAIFKFNTQKGVDNVKN